MTKSGLYRIVYSAEFGQFGGKPVGAIVSNYEFGPGPQDIALLQKCAAVAAMAHAPFFAAAGPHVLRRQGLPEPAEPEGPEGALRGAAVHEVEQLPRDGRLALRRPAPAALPAAPAVRLDDGAGQVLQLRRGRRRQPRRVLLGQRDVRVRVAPRRQLRQVPLVPEHHRPAGGRLGREPPAPPVRSDGRDPDEDPDRGHARRSAASTSSRRRASSA